MCVLSLYLILGCAYMRFVLHAKGKEQCPNYSFWQDFGNLQADGCDLVCRSKTSSGSRSYKGIGDDQLEGEEDKDDHLLPMWFLLFDQSQRWITPFSIQMFHAFQSGFSFLNFFILGRMGYTNFVLNLSSSFPRLSFTFCISLTELIDFTQIL